MGYINLKFVYWMIELNKDLERENIGRNVSMVHISGNILRNIFPFILGALVNCNICPYPQFLIENLFLIENFQFFLIN